MSAQRVYCCELRCLLCGRGFELEVFSLDELSAWRSRCPVTGCGGTSSLRTPGPAGARIRPSSIGMTSALDAAGH